MRFQNNVIISQGLHAHDLKPLSFNISNSRILSVCEYPTYIEARERHTNKSWMGLDSILVYLVEYDEENPSWAVGFSKDFG